MLRTGYEHSEYKESHLYSLAVTRLQRREHRRRITKPPPGRGTHHLSSDMRAVEGIRPMECVAAEARGVSPEPSWFPHTHATPLFPPMRALRTSFGGGGAGSCTALGRGGAVARISPASRPVRALSRNQLCQHKNASTASVDKTVARG